MEKKYQLFYRIQIEKKTNVCGEWEEKIGPINQKGTRDKGDGS
jgi:hypothetical protein